MKLFIARLHIRRDFSFTSPAWEGLNCIVEFGVLFRWFLIVYEHNFFYFNHEKMSFISSNIKSIHGTFNFSTFQTKENDKN